MPGIETSVNLTPGLWCPSGMTFAATDHHLLRITATEGLPEPGLRQLPEQRAFAAKLAWRWRDHQQPAAQRVIRGMFQVPGQVLASRLLGEQPITGRPHGTGRRHAAGLLQVHLQLIAVLKSQTNQRLTFQGQAQAACAFIGIQGSPRRQGQDRQVIQIGHG